MNKKEIKILACPSEIAAGKTGTAQGVLMFAESLQKRLGLENEIIYSPVSNKRGSAATFPNAKNIEQVAQNLSSTYHTIVSHTQPSDSFCFNVTADHSNAIATFSAFSDKFGAKNSGLIWVDAHADMHSPYTTPSGNIHGMPIAALLGLDNKEHARNPVDIEQGAWWDRLKDIGLSGKNPKLLPQNLVIIGLRDTEKEEDELMKKHNIKFFSPEDIKTKGIQTVIKECFEYLNSCDHLYCSFDIDSIDASLVPGTGTPVSNGLTETETSVLLKNIFKNPKLKSFGITEINPTLDKSDKTLELVSNLIIDSFLS